MTVDGQGTARDSQLPGILMLLEKRPPRLTEAYAAGCLPVVIITPLAKQGTPLRFQQQRVREGEPLTSQASQSQYPHLPLPQAGSARGMDWQLQPIVYNEERDLGAA